MKSSYKIALALVAVACAIIIVFTLSQHNPENANVAPAGGDPHVGTQPPPPAGDGSDVNDDGQEDQARPSLATRGDEGLSADTLDLLDQLDNLDSGTFGTPPADGTGDITDPPGGGNLAGGNDRPADGGNALTLGEPPADMGTANDLLRGSPDGGAPVPADTNLDGASGDFGKGGTTDFGKGGPSIGDTGTTDTGGQDTITPPPSPADNNNTPPRTHKVQEGEVLSTIAEHYFGSQRYWVHIAQANPTMDPNRIRPGQVLRLPTDLEIKRTETSNDPPEAPAGGNAGQVIYTVQSGDTLSTIAQQYYGSESKWTVVHEANRAKIGANPDRIREGMKLIIPPAPGNSR